MRTIGRYGKDVCAFTSVCREDAGWVPGYVAEAARLGMPYAVHLDRCTPGDHPHLNTLVRHDMCVGFTHQFDPAVEFDEQHKQAVLDLVVSRGYRWAMAWDVDEVYETAAPAGIAEIVGTPAAGGKPAPRPADWVDVRWLNAWGDRDHVRADGDWTRGHRVKFYRTDRAAGERWVFDHPITNGPKVTRDGRPVPTVGVAHPLVCLHLGMMTPELRRAHRDRWDRVYSTALKGDPNPYRFWREAVETEPQAVTVRHGYR